MTPLSEINWEELEGEHEKKPGLVSQPEVRSGKVHQTQGLTDLRLSYLPRIQFVIGVLGDKIMALAWSHRHSGELVWCCTVMEPPEVTGSYVPGRQKRGHKGSWNYVDKGPDFWGGFCQTGKKQSPINIKLGESVVRNYPSFKFNEHYLRKQKFHAKNNGHTIYVSLQNDTIEPVIYGGGLPGNFIFEQLHMHWESEHEFDGKRTSMEMHMVHYNSKYGSLAEASKHSDGIAVLAVFFDESEVTDPLIEDFFDSLLEDLAEGKTRHLDPPPGIPSDQLQTLSEEDHDNGEDSETHELFALRDLLPKKISRFFRYDGSLTTPGCDEVVQWTIFINRFPISRRVLEQVVTMQDHDNHFILRNYRPPQKLNGREVFIQLKDHDEPESETGSLSNTGSSNTGYRDKMLSTFFVCSYLTTNFNKLY